MKIEELASAISDMYERRTGAGILAGLASGRDACVATEGPFEVELIGANEIPTFHATKPYVRYHIDRATYGENGKFEG